MNPALPLAYSTPADVIGWKRWLVCSPLARIVIFAAMLIALGFAAHGVAASLGWTAKSATPLHHALVTMCIQLLPTLIGYLVLVKLIERRRVHELSPRSIPTLGVGGLIIGFALFSTVVGVLWLAGSYHVVGINTQVNWLPGVMVAGIGAGIGEEIVFRGVLFRAVEEGLGTWAALIASALFFGIAHIFNPGATWWSSIAIAIEAGLMLALLYHVTRSLWACIGLHAAWNISEGTIYGVSVSGTQAHGFLVSKLTGPDWLSGGVFGAEASVVAIAVCSTLSIVLLTIAWRRDSIVPPAWRRSSQSVTVAGAMVRRSQGLP